MNWKNNIEGVGKEKNDKSTLHVYWTEYFFRNLEKFPKCNGG